MQKILNKKKIYAPVMEKVLYCTSRYSYVITWFTETHKNNKSYIVYIKIQEIGS